MTESSARFHSPTASSTGAGLFVEAALPALRMPGREDSEALH